MEEQMLVNQIKSLIEKEIHGLKAENDKLKKANQEIKEAFLLFYHQLCKVDSDYLPLSSLDYKLIDLGLPSGTLWMDRNIGASSPTDCGLYFAWGETQGYTSDEVGMKKQFSWTDYKHCNGNDNKLTKYCNNPIKGNDGYTDSLVTLQTTDDAVLQNVHKCQMPTREQIQELMHNTIYEWTTQDGVDGGLFTSKTNGNSIFIPAAGYCDNGFVNHASNVGYIWSSSLNKNYPSDAWYMFFGSGDVGNYLGSRYCGRSVRGVSKV